MNSINKPFLLKPATKDYLWGGNRINDDFGKNISVHPLAETWECSTHPDGKSVIASGFFLGMTLDEVFKQYPEMMGSHAISVANGQFPIMIKFIDAKEDLSIQVHPNDEYAKQYENSLGKTEMWYVLGARSDSHIVYGFNCELDKDQAKQIISNDTVEKYLNTIQVHKNDVFFIEPGTIHAIGSGTLIAEIQENSNITYRLYDYNRVDKNGKKRQLHIDKALDVVNLKQTVLPRQPMRVLKYQNGFASESLGSCKYFQVDRIILNTEVNRNLCFYQTDSTSFRVLLCIDGCGSILVDDNIMNFFKGDCIFVPANSAQLKLHGKAQLLSVKC